MSHDNLPRSLTHRLFPFLSWFKAYQLPEFRNDLVAGITVAVVLVPQAMAYAMLAGLPPVYGLYAAASTPMIAALWGSLRQLATGPIAIMSLLVLTTLSPLAEPGSAQFIELALLLSFMVGILYLLVGLFKMGIIMAFISHSAVRGFTAAASLIIIMTQLPHFMGLKVARHEYVISMILELLQKLTSVHILTLAIGAVAFGIIYGLRRLRPGIPAALIALLVTTVIVAVFNLDQQGVAIIGKTPEGLPRPHLPMLNFDIISSLIGPAVVIALVSFAETYSVGKAISSETKQKVDVDQEFIGQGLANFVGSFLQSYPVSGSFSRTAINFSAGAKTGVSSVISTVVVILALLFLTPLFTYIPKATLAALVISAVLILFHPKGVFDLWKMNRHDCIVAICVFVLALLTKPDYALLIGVMISLIFFLWKTMHPRVVRVAKDPDLNMFVNADEFGKPSCPQILQLRSDNSIYFANAEYTIENILERLDEQDMQPKFLLVDLQLMAFIDMTGIDEIRSLQDEVKSRGIEFAIMDLHTPVMNVFKSSGLINEINRKYLLRYKGEAIEVLFQNIDHDYCKNTCPYTLFKECASVK